MRALIYFTYRMARRTVITVMGITVIAFGVIMIVTPGPALIVIPAGLAILATEYAWARHWLRLAKEHAQNAVNSHRERRARMNASGASHELGNKLNAHEDFSEHQHSEDRPP
ncbi:MAG: PGPGW domain-containing protein [Burkholderiales bacterium]